MRGPGSPEMEAGEREREKAREKEREKKHAANTRDQWSLAG